MVGKLPARRRIRGIDILDSDDGDGGNGEESILGRKIFVSGDKKLSPWKIGWKKVIL